MLSEILVKLRLKEPPKINKEDLPQLNQEGSPFQGMLRKLGYQNDSPGGVFNLNLEQQDTTARTERIYSFARNPPPEIGNMVNVPLAYFNFSSETRNSFVNEAQLNVYIGMPSSETENSLKQDVIIEVYQVMREKESKTKNQYRYYPKRNLSAMKKVTLNRGGWQSVDVQEIVQQWFVKEDSNHGIYVKCLFPSTNESLVVYPSDNDTRNNMYLSILTEEGDHARRVRREAMNIDCVEGSEENRCCRYPLVIDFEKFGWDFVIAPKKYMAYYCSGACPFRYLQRYLHTHLVSQALPDSSSGPCCFPTEMAPIMMVYLNENKEVLVAQVPGMVATRCGCA